MDGYSRSTMIAVLGGASLVGIAAGVGPNIGKSHLQPAIGATVHDVAVHTGIARQRPPQTGDMWGGCRDARAAGTAPIYRGEPGYRPDMDGDSDGVACEPVPD